MLTCPVCSMPLQIREKEAFCEKGHHFDRAKEGYFNLLLSSSSKGHGDDKKMLLARRSFLEKGYYSHLLTALEEEILSCFPEKGVFMDAGCGEGYYTAAVAERLEKEGKEVSLYAFDIAKDAARLTAKKIGNKGICFVGSCYKIPFKDASADVILSVFSPFAGEEFLRVLKPGGHLICAVPMPEHLFSLKKAVYDVPKLNEKVAEITNGLIRVSSRRVQKEILLSCGEDISALFGMTPFAHKTSREDMAKLQALSRICVETDFGVLTYRKDL